MDKKIKKRVVYRSNNLIIEYSMGKLSVGLSNNFCVWMYYEIKLHSSITEFLFFFPFLIRLLRLYRLSFYMIDERAVNFLIATNGYIYTIKDKMIQAKQKIKNGRSGLGGSFSSSANGDFVFAEYFSNPRRLPLTVYLSRDKGISWKSHEVYGSGYAKHLHGIFYDKYQDKYWIPTGDSDDEVSINIVSKELVHEAVVGNGNQMFRTCSIFFYKDFVCWFTDNPNGQNYFVKYNRNTNILEALYNISGPVIYTANYSGHILASTSVEPYTTSTVDLIYVDDKLNLKVLHSFRKDFAPFIFGFGTVIPLPGPLNWYESMLYFDAVSGLSCSSVELKEMGEICVQTMC